MISLRQKSVIFFTVWGAVVLLLGSLSYAAYRLSVPFPFLRSTIEIALFQVLSSCLPLGFGFGFFLLFLATLFGWIQIALLLGGYIDPHLPHQDLLKALKLLLRKIRTF